MAQPKRLFARTAWKRSVRQAIAKRDGFRCRKCSVFVGMRGQVVLDHIVPRGVCEDEWDQTNLQLLCASCHSQKTNRERWEGHQKQPRQPFGRRTRVTGRNLLLARAGILP